VATQPQKFPTANNKEDTSARVDLGLELNWIGFRFRLIFFLDFGFWFGFLGWDGVWFLFGSAITQLRKYPYSSIESKMRVRK